MKKQLLLLCLIACLKIEAGNKYYLSTTGSDTYTTSTISTPWQSIAKLNTILFTAGDSVFFKCGEIFRGTISINQSGTSTNNIVFTSYGSGAQPIISGALAVNNWTISGSATYGTIYQATFSSTPTQLFANNHEQIVARFPNNHSYLTINSSTLSSLVDNSLSSVGTATINNSKLCIHTRQWCWEKTVVSSVNSPTINFTTSVQLTGLTNHGYFLYDNLLHLDTINEWKYDASTQKINFIAAQSPTTMTCEASVSTYSNGVEFSSAVKYIKFYNLSFEKQANCGIFINNSGNQYIKIDNCSFARQYYYGVQDKGRYNEISNCYFREVDGLAIYVSSPGKKSIIHHNTFRNIGEFRNSGFGLQYNLSAIHNSASDSAYVHHNDIDSTGYCGISTDAAYCTVEKNIIKNAMLCNNDGAALKSWGPASHDNTIQNNIIYNSNGNTEGANGGSFSTPGIYFDFFVNNSIIKNNTITNHTGRGIFQNSGNINNSILGNVIYGSEYGIDLNGTSATTLAISGMTIKHNSLFALNTTAYLLKQIDMLNSYTVSVGYIDSNYLFQPYNVNNIALRMAGTTQQPFSFSSWQSTGNDLKSKQSFVNWILPTNNSTLVINPTDNVVSVPLTGLYLDLDSNYVCGSITLQPYTSKILINNLQACTVDIIENKEDAHFLIYPNPSQNYFIVKVQSTAAKIKKVQLLDITGKEIKQLIIDNEEIKINIENLPNGLYFVLVTDGNNSATTQKIIINK